MDDSFYYAKTKIVLYPWNNTNTFSEQLFEVFKTYIALIIFIVDDKNRNIGGKTGISC